MSRCPAALSLTVVAALTASTAFSSNAHATDDVHVEVTTEEGENGEVIEVTETHEHEHEHDETWGGLFVGTVISPYRIAAPTRPSWRMTSNDAQACLDPSGGKLCGNVRGFDTRLVLFEAKDRGDYPRAIGYFRTGYTAGRIAFNPANQLDGFGEGEARNLSYFAVPLFFGGNVYFLKNLPVRPYAGMGAGFDVLRVHYDRQDARDVSDASARIGFELHAGLEARITNYVSVSAEVQQQWSARRKLAGVPDFSNEGFSVIAGVTLAIPTRHSRKHNHVRVHTVKKTVVKPKRVEAKPAAVPDALKAPVAPVAPVPPADAQAPVAPEAPVAPAPPVEAATPTAPEAPAPAPVAAPAD